MTAPSRRPTPEEAERIAARLRQPSDHGATPTRTLVASLILIVCMIGLTGLTWARSRLADRVASPLADKIAGADRVSYYVIDEGEGPRFRLGPDELSLKLITHLVLPEDTPPYSPEAEQAYGILMRLHSLEGELLWERDFNVRTRQSKADELDRGRGWRLENAFMLDLSRELTDDRLTRVLLPTSPDGRDRFLSIELVPRDPLDEDVLGLVRAYVRHERPPDDLDKIALAPGAGRALVDHVTYRDWESLSEAEREAKLRYEWTRMAALGYVGQDYEILSIYETGFRVPRGTKTKSERQRVEPTRWLAFNVIGPATLELDIVDGIGDPRSLKIRRYSLDEVVEDMPQGGLRERTLEVPPGIHCYVFETEDLPLEFDLRTEAALETRVWFSEAERPVRVNEGGEEMIEPDLRRIPVVRLGPNWRELPRYALPDTEDVIGRTLRFDLRYVPPFAAYWPLDEPPEMSLDYCFVDAEGEEIRCERWTGAEVQESHFEGLQEGDEASGRASWARERWYEVSEPQSLRMVAPEGTAEVVLRPGDERVLVRAYGYWPEVPTRVMEPWRSHTTETIIWRYPPLETRTWFPLRASNWEELQDDEAIADLMAQVRLQPRGVDESTGKGGPWSGDDPDWSSRWQELIAGEDGWDPGPWVTLEPRGRHRRRSILEELDEQAPERLRERWTGSLFTELYPRRSYVTNLGAVGPSAPELHWQLDSSLLGERFVVDIDGTRHVHEIAESRGRWRLPVEGGQHKISVDLEDTRLTSKDGDLWIDRPVLVASPPVSRRRSVHELTTSLVFPLVKPDDGEAMIVNVVVYLPKRRPGAQLELSVDGGEPERIAGVVERVSVSERAYTIQGEGAVDSQGRPVDIREFVRFVDLEGEHGVSLESVNLRITLGPEVTPGPHEVQVDLVDGGRVWVRAFHRGVGRRERPATSWTQAARANELPGAPAPAPAPEGESGEVQP